MKIVVLYLRIIKKSDPNWKEPLAYDPSSKRFLESYKKFKPITPHELVVVNCGSEKHDGMFDEVAARYETDMGTGYDCGTYRTIGAAQDADLVFGLNTHTYFWRNDWLEPFIKTLSLVGPGIFGVTGSYELYPHLRTPALAFSPEIVRKYPHPVTNRWEAGEFEHGPENIALWAMNMGYPSILVAPSGEYGVDQWRDLPNGFRRGNQTDCFVYDRHTDAYKQANKEVKWQLTRKADGFQGTAHNGSANY